MKVFLFNENKLKIEDLIYFNELLKSNIPFLDCLTLLENKKNKKIFEDIRQRLKKGELIETFIDKYLPKEIRTYFLSFMESLSFQMALDLSIQFYQKQKSGSDSMLGKIAYPCILLFITITGLYLFDLYGLDSIFNLVKAFDEGINLYQDVRIVFRYVITITYYLMLIGIGLIFYFSRPSKLAFLYLFLSKHFPNTLVCTYYSEEFVSLLLICISRGFGSKQSIELLKKMKHKPIISLLAYHLDSSLLEGNELKDAVKQKYFDNSLSRFINISAHTNDFERILNSYIVLCREKISFKMKQYSLTIQLFTYLFIGLIIIFIYQILFMPMQAISSF